MYKFLLFSFALITASSSVSPAEEAIEVYLPNCWQFALGKDYFEEDGLYHEYFRSDSNQVRVIFSIKDGKRQGPLKVFDKDGQLMATAYFEQDELRDNTLLLLSANNYKLSLKRDNPLWFFNDNLRVRSGWGQKTEDGAYVWLAGVRFHIEDEEVSSFSFD